MLLVADRFGGNAKNFCQQLVMVADALVLPVNLLGWIVEGVCSSHFEDGHVSSTCWSDEFDIGIPDAGLADHERIGRRGHRSLSDVWLKVVDRSADEVDIVSPSCHYRVWRNAGVAMVREIVHELNPHLWHGVSSCRWRISDESPESSQGFLFLLLIVLGRLLLFLLALRGRSSWRGGRGHHH